MTTILAKKAFLHTGWANNVRFRIADGLIESVETGCNVRPDNDCAVGIAIPGIANAHSHAFQRALAGHAERKEPTGLDTFWSWRDQMYSLAGAIDADGMAAVARQAFAEMLCVGYTSVVEFHYLHGEPTGNRGRSAMFQAIVQAAADTGIRLTYVPVLYERAGFDEPEPKAEQRRFAMSPDEFIDHYEFARDTTDRNTTVGIGAHSLRAVTRSSLRRLTDVSKRDECPMHMHIAEQSAEVDQCLAAYNARPVEWLVRELSPDDRWCLVHATHISAEELASLCECGAVVCLCPSTEANLGDGLFPLRSWFERGGRIAIGSDSQITINPFEELRWLEYGQRLSSHSRNIAAGPDSRTGRSLFEQVLEGGGIACGHGGGQLHAGALADLVTLDEESPMLAGHDAESILDALVFVGARLPIDRVMVGGKWRVVNGDHVASTETKRGFAEVVRNLWPASRVST
ncbi:MAG: formimidoylglutamate deiminase [Rhodospirillaceae bacterium]|nr:formimidoylglutamate deiminase [Rhodospirillaceae bacterium]